MNENSKSILYSHVIAYECDPLRPYSWTAVVAIGAVIYK